MPCERMATKNMALRPIPPNAMNCVAAGKPPVSSGFSRPAVTPAPPSDECRGGNDDERNQIDQAQHPLRTIETGPAHQNEIEHLLNGEHDAADQDGPQRGDSGLTDHINPSTLSFECRRVQISNGVDRQPDQHQKIPIQAVHFDPLLVVSRPRGQIIRCRELLQIRRYRRLCAWCAVRACTRRRTRKYQCSI